MEDDGEADVRKIFVEAKSFTLRKSKGNYIFRESHRKGAREISLTADQAKWICKMLEEKHRFFAENRRKERRVFDGIHIILTEGSNEKGVYLSIHIYHGQANPSFVIVPAGPKGSQWGKVSTIFKSLLDSPLEKQPPLSNRNFVSNLQRSYAEIAGFQPSLESGFTMVDLIRRVSSLESELLLLRSVLPSPDLAAPAHPKSAHPKSCENKSLNPKISDPMVQFDFGVPTVAQDIPDDLSLLEQRGCILDEINSNECSVGDFSKHLDVDLTQPISNANFEDSLQASHGVDSNQMVTDSESEDDDAIYWDDSHEHSSGMSTSEEQSSVPSDALPVTTPCDLVQLEEEGQLVHSPEEADGEDQDNWENWEETTTPGIYWNTQTHLFYHNSGMCYDPSKNEYFIWINDDNDERVLFFVATKNNFVLAFRGKKGEINKAVLAQEGWDRNYIAETHKFPSGLIDRFSRAHVSRIVNPL